MGPHHRKWRGKHPAHWALQDRVRPRAIGLSKEREVLLVAVEGTDDQGGGLALRVKRERKEGPGRNEKDSSLEYGPV